MDLENPFSVWFYMVAIILGAVIMAVEEIAELVTGWIAWMM